MSLYATGTITGALNATTITGTGTKWSDAKIGIANGSVLFISSNAGVDGVYQIKRVINDTSIELAQPIYKAFTNAKYSILVAEASSTASFANQLAAALGYYQAQIDGWQQIMTGTGDVELTAPDGTKVTINSFSKMGNDIEKKANSGGNSDITSLAKLTNITYITDKQIGTYDLISMSSNPADSKNYLRKFRGGQGQNIFHEIVKGNRYSISIGTTDSVEVFAIDTASSDTGGVSGYFRGNKILVVSDYGIGINGAPIIEDANSVMINQFAGAGGVNGKNWFDQYQAAIIASRGYQTFQIQSNGQLGHRATATNGSTWTPWRKVWDDGNTTVDSNGFIKKASPIIKIFHDGSFDVNAESEGASVNREDIGIYRVSNILGMNSDGAWGGIDGGFEVPTDRNGQRLVWLDYEVDADGSILVKTYHRTYPDAPAFARNIKDGYEEGAPIDIPSDQFLSVRVEMPQDSIWNLAQKAAQEAMEQEEITEE